VVLVGDEVAGGSVVGGFVVGGFVIGGFVVGVPVRVEVVAGRVVLEVDVVVLARSVAAAVCLRAIVGAVVRRTADGGAGRMSTDPSSDAMPDGEPGSRDAGPGSGDGASDPACDDGATPRLTGLGLAPNNHRSAAPTAPAWTALAISSTPAAGRATASAGPRRGCIPTNVRTIAREPP